MKHLLSLSLIVWLISISFHTCSQTRTIKGIVTDQKTNEPIPFAPVMVKNSSQATTTDENGKFQLITKDSNVTLVVKYLGYQIQEVKLKRGIDIVHILMQESVLNLTEVTVTSDRIVEMDKTSTGASYSFEGARSYSTRASKAEEAPRPVVYSDPNAKAGVLTAGEINDFSKWILWKDIESKDLKEWKTLWKIQPDQWYSIQVETENGMPVVDAEAKLVNDKQQIFWSARTDNTGKAELWANMFGNSTADHLAIQVSLNGENYSLNNVKEFHDGINILKIPVACGASDAVDVAFVVDATGSMQDEIDYLKAELDNIIIQIKDSLTTKNLNLGCVFYRDHTDEYLTKKSDLTSDIQTTINFIKENNAGGGDDYPEAVDEALNTAINHLQWRPDAAARMIFLVLDAPPHSDPEIINQLQRLVMQAAAKGIRIIPVTCSGIDKSTEYLLRSFALATNGTYVFLTDNSGVGGTHIKPTTDKYDVELLNNILFRVIYNFSHTVECILSVTSVPSDTLVVSNPVFTNAGVDTSAVATIDSSYHESGNLPGNGDQKFVRWKYYPNPTFGIVHVEVEGTIKEFFVTDLSGKIILRREANKNETFEINLSDFAAGTYFITAEYSPDKRVSGKVVLVH
jgi:CarboxypepD_reg-like domain/von Willebrand factor type A domain/Secretion system C-terminal sorting domain